MNHLPEFSRTTRDTEAHRARYGGPIAEAFRRGLGEKLLAAAQARKARGETYTTRECADEAGIGFASARQLFREIKARGEWPS